MRRVVVGFDGSPAARAALEWATDEARIHNAPIEVWAVLEQSAHGSPAGRDDAGAALDDLRAVVTQTCGSAVELQVGRGGAAAVLCEACSDSDLLVVGSRGRSPFAGLLLGSVSRACLHHAPCSVAVVRPGAEPARTHGRVVVGLDSSGHSRHALHVAAQEARLRGAALHAVHAVHWDPLGVEWIEPTPEQLLEWGADLVRAELDGSGVSAHPVVESGSPAEVLVGQSADADLLVLGSRGHNPLANLALGSTSDCCVRRATCPVMIVRPGMDGADTP